LNDKVGCVYEHDLPVQNVSNEKENNENKLLESVECKKNDIEHKNMSRTIKKQKQIICVYSRRIKNQNIKLRKYKKCMLIARRDLKALELKKKQNDTAALLRKI